MSEPKIKELEEILNKTGEASIITLPNGEIRAVDIKGAISTIVSAIYFRDSSDFKGALWDALRFLDNDAADLLYASDEEAYKKYVEVQEEATK